MTTEKFYDFIVVGCGAFGSASCYWLSKLDPSKKILGLEQFSLGHHNGGSQDHSRIIRYAYRDQMYTQLARHAYTTWSALESEAECQLVFKTGGIVFGNKNNDKVNQYAKAMKAQGIPFDDYTGEYARKKWPQFNFADDDRVLFQAESGLVDAKRANAAHITLAKAHGVTVLENTRVSKLTPIGQTGQVIIETNNGNFKCDRLILTADAWMNKLLATFGYQLNLKVTKEQVTYYNTIHFPEFSIHKFPIWISYEENHSYYGIGNYGELGPKAAVNNIGLEVDPDHRDFEANQDALQILDEYLKRKIPNHLGPKFYTKTCLYNNTPDGEFIIDQLPDHPQICLAIGTGHGFKFASLIGLILSQLALEGKTSFPIDAFKVTRPILGLKKLI